MANVKIANAAGKTVCHDCKKAIKIQGKEIKNGGVMLVYPSGGAKGGDERMFIDYENAQEKTVVLKCQDCFRKSPELSNYRPCEVYSRIVGYLRPVQQWNLGKKQEFGEREEYRYIS